MEKGVLAHGRGIFNKKKTPKNKWGEERKIKQHREHKKKLQILFFLPTLSALFPRPEFCYIQSYICSPRLRRGCS